MAEYSALTFPQALATEPIQMLTRHRLFRGPYVTFGGFVSVLAFIYENCALLGRGCRKNIEPLIALVTEPWADRAAFLTMIKDEAGERLGQYRVLQGEEPHHLWRLIQVTEYAKEDVYLPQQGAQFDKKLLRNLERAAEAKFPIRTSVTLANLITVTGCEGIGFGVRYPEKTWRMVENFRQPVAEEEWARAYRAGAVDSQRPNIDSAEDAESVAFESVREYIAQYRPDLAGSI